MAIKIAAWNVECRLSGWAVGKRGSVEQIINNIHMLDADVLVLPEAFMDTLQPDVDDQLRRLGYEIHDVPYDDYGREHEKFFRGRVHIRIVSRLPAVKVERIRPGNVRNLIVCHVVDPESGRVVRVIATHLDDRSESQRMLQIHDLVSYINNNKMPTVMLGDFNAMWHQGRARFLSSRPMRAIARIMPYEKLRYTASRVADMAIGTTLQQLAIEANLRDIDPRHRSTATPKARGLLFMPSIRLIQIDHIFISEEVIANGITIGADGGSDHRSVMATISLRERYVQV